MKLIPNQKSIYGKFDLIPEKGQKLGHYIDFESKLIVVNESPIDISMISAQYGGWGVIIPTKTYVIDPNEQKILNFQQWKKYFNYEPIETISKDGKLKEVWQRKHEKERNIDSYEGYLMEIETGKKIIDGASSVAFQDNERVSLIKRYYQRIEQIKKSSKSIEKGNWQFCPNCKKKILQNRRYPKYACRNCVNLIKDELGNQLDYKNTHELFGCFLRLKSNQKEIKIFINDDEYHAEHARFGGIVHQKKEKTDENNA